MLHYDIWIHADRTILEAAFEEGQSIVCSSLLLCAGAGCSCAVGIGKKVCNEVYHGTDLRVSASEGPTWFTLVYLMRESLHFEIYVDNRPGVDQLRELKRRLEATGGLVYWSYDWKAATLEERIGHF